MAWNDSGNGKDPWKRDGDEPNDLDQIVQNWQRRLSGIFGGGGSRQPGGSGGYFLIVLLLIAWGATGFYRVDEAERGVVQRFGAYPVPDRNRRSRERQRGVELCLSNRNADGGRAIRIHRYGRAVPSH